jgi:hypothetical protein
MKCDHTDQIKSSELLQVFGISDVHDQITVGQDSISLLQMKVTDKQER